MNPDDSFIPNLRNYKAWRLFIDEMKEFVKMTSVDGLFFDNADSLPLYFKPNREELSRRDLNDVPSYTLEEQFTGKVCDPKAYNIYDYRNSEKWPSSFWFYVCKEIRTEFPHLMLLGDLHDTSYPWTKDSILIMSGLVPRSHKYPKLFSRLFGKKLKADGSIIEQKPDNVNLVKQFIKNYNQKLPKNSIMISGMSNYSMPYTGLLFGKGTWPMIDVQFFSQDIPMTFLSEISGATHRLKGLRYFTLKNENLISLPDPKAKYFKDEFKDKKTMLSKIEAELEVENQMKLSHRENSMTTTLTMNPLKKTTSTLVRNDKMNQSFDDINLHEDYEIFYDPDEDRHTFNYNQLWDCHKTASEACSKEDLQKKEEFMAGVFDEKCGFDLGKIKHHYEHRAKLRNKYEVFQKGDIFETRASHAEGNHANVLSFMRIYYPYDSSADGDLDLVKNISSSVTEVQIGLVTTNMSMNRNYVELDVKSSQYVLGTILGSNPEKTLSENKYVVNVTDIVNGKVFGSFTLFEFLNIKHEIILDPMETSLLIATVDKSTTENLGKVQEGAWKRLRESISRGKQLQYNCLLQELIDKTNNQDNLFIFITSLLEFEQKWLSKGSMNI